MMKNSNINNNNNSPKLHNEKNKFNIPIIRNLCISKV